jgi:2-keto-4-pentenoate hydratase/2-oxohepta-3-ene-1,7-dioic acid hydratase in catechol pathway
LSYKAIKTQRAGFVKLLTFDAGQGARLGALTDHGVVDLTAAGDPTFASMQRLIEGGTAALDAARGHVRTARQFLDPAAVRWIAPLPRPEQIRDSMGFEEHAINSYEAGLKLMALQAPDPAKALAELRVSRPNTILEAMRRQPIYYKANRFAVAGPDADIVWPSYSKVMDFELEMGCVIGRTCRDVPKDRALDYVFGYTIFNDLSARDAQMAEMPAMLGPCKGKDFDNANVLGPVITTADEIGDPYDLRMQARVNGETWCDSSSSTMNVRFGDMIAHISRGETLHPGEIIGSGTVGMGCGLERGRFLEHGDVVELEIDKIGVLRNRILRG